MVESAYLCTRFWERPEETGAGERREKLNPVNFLTKIFTVQKVAVPLQSFRPTKGEAKNRTLKDLQ